MRKNAEKSHQAEACRLQPHLPFAAIRTDAGSCLPGRFPQGRAALSILEKLTQDGATRVTGPLHVGQFVLGHE